MRIEVAVLGLGEAGGTFATGLAAAGCVVRGFDPVAAPPGVELATTHAERRLDEMEAAAAYLEELGVEPRVSRAAAARLEGLIDRT